MARGDAVIDGRLGLKLAVPAEWWLVQTGETFLNWTTQHTDKVGLQFVPEPISLSAELLDDYRHDLRLVAAGLGGGLVEADFDEKLGLAGIVKYPQESGRGFAYAGYALVPVPEGHHAVTIVAHEGPFTGARETGVHLHTGLDISYADPYDFAYPGRFGGLLARFRKQRHWVFPSNLALRSTSDDRGFDKHFSDHPLTRVRVLLVALGNLSDVELTLHETGGAALQPGFMMELPQGFVAHAASRLPDRDVFRRISFAGRSTYLSAGVLADPEPARDPGRAAEQLKRQVGEGKGHVLWGPQARRQEVEGLGGTLVELEYRLGRTHLAATSFFMPWGEGSLEVNATSCQDDRPRTRALVERTVPTIR